MSSSCAWPNALAVCSVEKTRQVLEELECSECSETLSKEAEKETKEETKAACSDALLKNEEIKECQSTENVAEDDDDSTSKLLALIPDKEAIKKSYYEFRRKNLCSNPETIVSKLVGQLERSGLDAAVLECTKEAVSRAEQIFLKRGFYTETGVRDFYIDAGIRRDGGKPKNGEWFIRVSFEPFRLSWNN